MIATNTSFALLILFLILSAATGMLGIGSVGLFLGSRVLADVGFINVFLFFFITMSVRFLRSTGKGPGPSDSSPTKRPQPPQPGLRNPFVLGASLLATSSDSLFPMPEDEAPGLRLRDFDGPLVDI